MNIGKKIKNIRKQLNLTMLQLSQMTGISQPVLSKLENNIRIPDIPILETLCDVFNITLSDFFNEESDAVVLTDELKLLVEDSKNLSAVQINALITVAKAFKEN